MMPLNVLIACEESQAVCLAFRKRGHHAFSCDIQECSGGHPEWHIQGDALEAIRSRKWDLLVAHPPCTYLARPGLHYTKTKPGRLAQLRVAYEFVIAIWYSDCPRVCIENPVGWLNTNWRKPSQIVHPYYFNDHELKETCLWLRGLSRLNGDPKIHRWKDRPQPSKWVTRKNGPKKGGKFGYYFCQGRSAKEKSKTFPGIARAMAEQWSPDLGNTWNL